MTTEPTDLLQLIHKLNRLAQQWESQLAETQGYINYAQQEGFVISAKAFHATKIRLEDCIKDLKAVTPIVPPDLPQ